jgi:hypothetical protein
MKFLGHFMVRAGGCSSLVLVLVLV